MNPTSQLPAARTAPAWIAVVTTTLCALGAVLWLGTRPTESHASKPAAVSAPSTDPAIADARAARTAKMRERMDRMQERIAKLEKKAPPTGKKPPPTGKKPPRVTPTPDPDPIPHVVIDPECLRNPLCKTSR